MAPARLLVLISLVAFLLAAPAAASAAGGGCDASDDAAAIDQYCELLSTPNGNADVTQHHMRRLVFALPVEARAELEHHGPLGQVLLALPAGTSRPPGRRNAGEKKHLVHVKGLLPGPGVEARSVVAATAGAASKVSAGLGWVLVVTLIGVSGISFWNSAFRSHR